MIFALSLEGHLLVEHDGRFQNNPFCSSFFKYVLCHYLGSDFFHGCVSVSLFCFVVFFRYCFRFLSLMFPCSFITLFSFIIVYYFINVSVFSRQSVSVFFHYLGRVFFHCCFRFLALLFPFSYLI